MNITHEYMYWGPLLFKSKVSDDIVNELLTRGLKTKKSHRHKLAGHFKDEYLYSKDDMSWFVNKMKPYFLQHKHISENVWYKSKCDPIELTSLWINTMRAGDFNPPHTHDGELSFVIYLQVPDKIKAEFDSYEGRGKGYDGPGSVTFGIEFDATKKHTISQHTFLPKVGDLFIFPANLPHYVAPFKCEGERISVSGNLIKQ